MTPDHPIKNIWKYLNGVNWSEPGFELRKAHAMALFSELAYFKIPDFELKNANRVNLIPSKAYQDALTSGNVEDFDSLVRSLEFGEYFVVVRRYAVVVGVRTPNMIVVAIRGTTDLYDWFTNLRALRYNPEGGHGTARFHKGFYRAISACLEPVSLELRRLIGARQEQVPIYVTGHSLGGAMAAIMHAIWSMVIGGEWLHDGMAERRLRTIAGYTFGMPRYGNFSAVANYRAPYHMYNDFDIVPTVPPKWLGFENSFNEFRLDGVSLESVQSRESLKFLSWISLLLTGRGVAHHSIEIYRDRISRFV